MADDSAPVEVSLVEAAPPVSVQETSPPEPTPEPVHAPTPEPKPEPVQTQEATKPPLPKPTLERPKLPAPARQPSLAKAPALHRPSSSHVSTGVNPHGAPVAARPRYRSNPKPEYPIDARRQHQSGVVLLLVEVSADGRALNVSLKRSSGVTSLDEAAIRAVRQWTFEPANVGALPVASRAEVPVKFSLAQ